VLRSVPPGRAPAVVGCAENPKLPKINARVIRGQAGVGRTAMSPAKHHRVPAILLGFKWKIRIILGLPWIVRIEIRLSTKGGNS
ncbi:MAG TPA: hypothetical protein DCL09_06425, partial [Sutterella sp.]|nr:hypothetical protein [Sutterella sp.]